MSSDAQNNPVGITPPAVLRQEGPHRVKVAPGATSAFSSAPPASGPKLNPKTGPSVRSAVQPAKAKASGEAQLRSGAKAQPASQAQRHRVGADGSWQRWSGPQDADAERQAQVTQALQQRLDHLAQLNTHTSGKVVKLERDLQTDEDKPDDTGKNMPKAAPRHTARSQP